MRLTVTNIKDVFKAKQCSIETMELKGYELVKEFFVDSSGFGAEYEPALTPHDFIDELTQLIVRTGTVQAKITRSGQFQVYVGIFTKTGKKQSKQIRNNLLDVELDNGTAIRLHDTNIISFIDNTIILNSGGWRTATTKKCINEYLPNGYYLSQKNFEWHLKTPTGLIEFEDKMAIAV